MPIRIEYNFPPPYKSGERPTIILINNKRYDWIYEYFQLYSNVIHIQEDTFSSKIGYIKRQILYRVTGKVPKFIEKIIYKYIVSENLPLEWWQKRLLEEGYIDAIIVIHPAVLPRKLKKYNIKKIFWAYDDDVPLFFRVGLALTLHGFVDTVYVTHEKVIDMYKKANSPAKLRYIPYGIPTSIYYPDAERTGLEPAIFFIGTVTGTRKIFFNYLKNEMKKRGLPEIKLYTSIQHDYADAVRRFVLAIDVPRRREVNWRVFEVIGAGGLLVTGSKEEISKLIPVNGLFAYQGPILSHNLRVSSEEEIRESARQAAGEIERALDDPEEAGKVASEVCKYSWRHHTLHDRICVILDDLGYNCNKMWQKKVFEEVRNKAIKECEKLKERIAYALSVIASKQS